MHLLETWKRSPLLRVALPLMAGIVLSYYDCLLIALASTCCLLGCFFFMQSTINKHWRRSHFLFLNGIFYSCICTLLGMLLARSTSVANDGHHIYAHRGGKLQCAVQLLDEPKPVGWGWSATAEVLAVVEDSVVVPCRGRIALLLQDSLHTIPQHVDEVLWLQAEVAEVARAKNPFEFDFATYRSRQGVHVQAFVEQHHWKKDSLLYTATWRGSFIRLRERLLDALRAQSIEQREMGVLAALVLGKTTEMDAEVMQAYAAAGAVHVLAVSGLHVALIYMLLKPIFSWIFGKRRARYLRWLIPTALLWFYAALTGFSPSLLRAALMFSCFIEADTFGRSSNIYNTMSASVVVLVVCDPMVIYSMGFVLSYLAVLGIVVIQPRIHAWFYFSPIILRKAWELTSVSIAAQIATLPVTLYLFHQFPTWFIITNLLVIPLSTLVLYVALLFFAFQWWIAGSAFIGGVLGLLTRIMNDVMEASSHWPAALIDEV
jgi:competence protein ComEC